MNATELATLSMTQLKALCVSHAIEVTGDKRLKATYINAIESFQSKQTVIEIETLPAIPDPFDDSYEFVISSETVSQSKVPDVSSIIDKSDNTATLQQLTDGIPIPQATPQQPTLTPQQRRITQKHSASIVMIIPLVLLSLAIISIRIGISIIIPLIGSLINLMGLIWKSVPDSIATNSIPVDYFAQTHSISA